jgi:hypothetical protein
VLSLDSGFPVFFSKARIPLGNKDFLKDCC